MVKYQLIYLSITVLLCPLCLKSFWSHSRLPSAQNIFNKITKTHRITLLFLLQTKTDIMHVLSLQSWSMSKIK